MSAPQDLGAALRALVAQGLLPAGTALPPEDSRPWPVLLLMALGAWLAALPLLGVLGLLFGDLLRGDAGPYLAGGLTLAAALVVLRARSVPLFIEQLAVPALLVGLLGLGVGLFRDVSVRSASLALAVLTLAAGAVLPRAWLRVPLGAGAAAMLALAAAGRHGLWSGNSGIVPRGLAWNAITLAALVALALVAAGRAGPARRAAAVDALGAGALLGALAGLAWWSGMSFMVGGATGSGLAAEVGRELAQQGPRPGDEPVLQGLSVAAACAGVAWLAWQWPRLRQPRWALALGTPVLLAWFVPALGAALLAAAGCAVMHRFRLAAAAALAAAWATGGFYYALAWPLSQKALLMLAAGALLALAAWGPSRRPAAAPAQRAPRGVWAGLALAAVAVLGVANLGIWRNEQLIAHGRPVLVQIVPADPRSLLQGDYMRLAFRLPPDVPDRVGLDAGRPRVLATLDERGVATPRRVARPGELPGAGELQIELAPADGRWTLVTDAWHFREGQAARFAQARYGEFRVQPDGRALLVGLRDEQLRPLDSR